MPPVKTTMSAQDLWDAAPGAPMTDNSNNQMDGKPPSQRLWEAAADVGDTAAGAVKNGVVNAASDLGNLVTKGPPAAYDFLADSAHNADGFSKDNGTGALEHEPGSLPWMGAQAIDALGGIGRTISDRLNKLPPDQQKAILTKTGITAASVMAAGPTAGVFRQAIMASVGNLIGDNVSQAAGFEPDRPLFTKEEAKKEGGRFVENLLLPKIFGVVGSTMSKAGEAFQDASVPIGNLEKAQKAKPGYLTGRLGVGKNTAGDMAIVDTLKDGEKTLAKVVADEFPDKIDNMGEMQTALEDSISMRTSEKNSIMGNLNKALPNSGIRPFSRNDTGYAGLTTTIRKLKGTGVGGDLVEGLEGLQSDLTDAFQKPLPQNQTGKMFNPKDFQGMNDLLDQVYDKMRGLKAFDPKNAMKGSEVAANKATIRAYRDVADSIKEAIVDRATKLEAAGLVNKGTASRIGELNQEIHDLIPFQTATERAAYYEFQTMRKPQPANSLLAPDDSAFNLSGSLRSQALDQVTKPITQYPVRRAQLRESLGFAPDTLDEMKDAAGYALGRQQVPSIEPQGVLGAVGAAESGVGDALTGTAQSGAIPIAGAAQPSPALYQLPQDPKTAHTTQALGAIVNDPASMQIIQNDPDINPDTVTMLEQSKNGTDFEQRKALGQFKIEARNKPWFPPPLMKGIHSFIATPGDTYHGEKVMGTITDMAEGAVFMDALNQIPDVSKRARLKSAFNSPGHFVLEFPPSLKAGGSARAAPAPVPVEPKEPQDIDDSGSSSAPTLSAGQESMERIVHDY